MYQIISPVSVYQRPNLNVFNLIISDFEIFLMQNKKKQLCKIVPHGKHILSVPRSQTNLYTHHLLSGMFLAFLFQVCII